jgi:hypothetical protein
MSSVISLAGQSVTRAFLSVAYEGPWFVDCDMADEAIGVQARVVFAIGDFQAVGTVVPTADGTHGLQRKTRVVAGAAGWGNVIRPRPYHNDAGVSAREVASDVASEVGETLGSFAGGEARMRANYERRALVASQALREAARGAAWWVDFDGVTHVGERFGHVPTKGSYTVLSYDPRERIVTLAVDDLRELHIGSQLTEGLDQPLVVRAFDVDVSPDAIRVRAWCGESGISRVVDALRAIHEAHDAGRLPGQYRYRVTTSAGDRYYLQLVRKRPEIPQLPELIGPVALEPGVAGLNHVLAKGGIVRVAFVDEDPSDPVIVGFGGPDQPGYVPESTELGGPGGSDAARKGDTVECPMPPAIFSGTIGGVPASGVITFPLMKIQGVITAGSAKGVRIA